MFDELWELKGIEATVFDMAHLMVGGKEAAKFRKDAMKDK